MRTLLALSIVVASFAFAEAQPVDPPQTPAPLAEIAQAAPTKVTHFLIDASGSMEMRQTKLEAAVRAKRAEVEQAGLPPPIETRFGGDNGGTCAAQIEIGRVETGEYQNDNSQIGAALGAALNSVGSATADIFIFTDEEQTPGCGPDICTVAERYLPKAGIFVQSVPIDASPTDHIRLSCVRSAQDGFDETKPLFNLSINVEQQTSTTDVEQTGSEEFTWDQANPLERWHWLAICLSFVILAISIGSIFGKRAHHYESKIEGINQKLRLAAAQRLDAVTEDSVRNVLTAKDLSPPTEDEMHAPRWLKAAKISGWLGSLLLLFIMVWESSWSLLDLGTYARNARTIGWQAVGSDFSNFGILLVTPLLFAGAQHGRFVQAQRTFALVTNSATTAEQDRQSRELAKKLDNLHAQYTKLREQVLSTKFSTPVADPIWPRSFLNVRGRARARLLVDTTADDFELISAKARELAVGSDLPRQGLSEPIVAAEIARLRDFAPTLAETLFKSAKISSFVERLLKSGSRPTEHTSQWEELADKTTAGTSAEIRSAIKGLASALRST